MQRVMLLRQPNRKTRRTVNRVRRELHDNAVNNPALILRNDMPSQEEIELLEELARIEAREHFWAYRQHMRPKMLKGWWQREIAHELQRFYCDWVAGKRPVIIFEAPPQHGKSVQVRDLVGWVSGKRPDTKTIYASFSDDLGIAANTHVQRLWDDPKSSLLFPELILASQQSEGDVYGRPSRNKSFIEFVGREGSFRNTTVMGQITGQGLNLGVIDDPIKGRLEAKSKAARDKAWEWLTDDFFTRFSDDAGFILMMTRWHLDDPAGRFLEKFPDARVLKYAAIAEKDELYRDKGEALFPEHKSLEFLLKRKTVMSASSWESLYQQNPIVVGGGLFPIDKFEVIASRPAKQHIRKSVRYWDKAGTDDGGAYTCGVLLHNMLDGTVVISDVRRGQWSALEREKRIKNTAEMDRASGLFVEIWVEQEPGSGGKESAEATIRNLKGFVIKADKVTGDKETRADPYAAQVQGGNVYLVAGHWNQAFVDEHEQFPSGKFKDQVDAAAGAFAKSIVGHGTYDSSMRWVDGSSTERRMGINPNV